MASRLGTGLLTWLDVFSDDGDVLISVWPGVFMPETNYMAQLVSHDAKLVTVFPNGYGLGTPSSTPNVGATAGQAQKHSGQQVRGYPGPTSPAGTFQRRKSSHCLTSCPVQKFPQEMLLKHSGNLKEKKEFPVLELSTCTRASIRPFIRTRKRDGRRRQEFLESVPPGTIVRGNRGSLLGTILFSTICSLFLIHWPH